MAEVIDGILIRDVETKNIMTKSSLPVGGYSVNPYVGCTHACKYCYASFMKRFTGHKEEWKDQQLQQDIQTCKIRKFFAEAFLCLNRMLAHQSTCKYK